MKMKWFLKTGVLAWVAFALTSGKAKADFLELCQTSTDEKTRYTVSLLLDSVGESTCADGWKKLERIEFLDLSASALEELSPLSSMVWLRKLALDENRIRDISAISGLRSLEWLSLAGNRISDLRPLLGLTKLIRINVDRNWLNPSWVQAFRASRPRVHVEEARPQTFAEFCRRADLSLEERQMIQYFYSGGMGGNCDVLDERIAREGKFLGRETRIPDPAVLWFIREANYLSLPGADLKSLDFLRAFEMLFVLKAPGSRIRDLSPLATQRYLDVLDLSGNQIEDLSPLAGQTDLKLITLDRNRIRALDPIRNNTGLIELSFRDNEVESLAPLRGFQKLRSLSMGWNPITRLQALWDLPLWNLEVTGAPIPEQELVELRKRKPGLTVVR